VQAGLVRQTKEGRSILCTLDFDAVRDLSDYLLTECCADTPDKDHTHG